MQMCKDDMTAPEGPSTSLPQHDTATRAADHAIAVRDAAAPHAALDTADATRHPSSEAVAIGSSARMAPNKEETAAEVASAAKTAASDALDAHASSEAVNSTLMGIALLAYLQNSAERDDDEQRDHASAPSTSNGAATARVPLERTSSRATDGAAAVVARLSPSERVPRRYQKISSDDGDDHALAKPLIWTLAAIKAREHKPQYTCKR